MIFIVQMALTNVSLHQRTKSLQYTMIKTFLVMALNQFIPNRLKTVLLNVKILTTATLLNSLILKRHARYIQRNGRRVQTKENQEIQN